MTALTVDLDDRLIDSLREIAARDGTSVEVVARHLLEQANEDPLSETRRRLVELMENQTGRLGPDYKWDREALYAERLLPRHEHPGLRSTGQEG